MNAGMMLGMVAVSLLSAILENGALSQDSGASLRIEPLVVPLQLVPPPLSVAKADFFRENPAAWSQFLSQLPRHPSGPPQPTPLAANAPLAGGTWQSPCCTSFFPTNPLLLTDGTVIAHAGSTADWYKLTPDIYWLGYVNGTWTQIASLPLVINGTSSTPPYILPPPCYPMAA